VFEQEGDQMEDVRQPAPPPPAQPGGAPPPVQQQGAPGLAVAGFVVSLIGLLGAFVFGAGFIPAVVGLVLSIVGRRQAVDRGAPTGLATAGIVLGIVGAVIAILWFILFVVASDNTDLNNITFTTTTR
jgi:hypothetical protein